MSQESIDTQERIDELYDKWEAEYQKQATLIQALEALCATWTQANSGEAGASCFRCGKCGEWYTTISDALECCQAAEGE